MIVVLPSYSQINRGGQPFSYDTVFSRQVNIQMKRMGVRNDVVISDLDKETEEARIEQLTGKCNSCRSGGKYYGKEIDMGIDFFSSAQMTPMDDGEIWTMKIVSEKSEGFQFLFNDFYLPDGCLLFFYNEERTMHLGAFTSANNRDDGHFITQHLNGNIAHIELFVPADADEQPRLFLDKVVYIFDNSLRRGPFSNPSSPEAEYCHINTACQQGDSWREEIKSVALILEKTVDKYYGFCTGALINKAGNYDNTSNPYFLTANHCYQIFGERNNPSAPVITSGYSDPKNWVFLFRHESTSCFSNGSDVSNSLTKSATGATIVAKDNNSATSDYLLLRLNNTVSELAAYDVSFSGWNKDEDPYRTQVTGIHHPSGDVKKISISNNTPDTGQFIDEEHFTSALNHHWKVIWSEGITAPGSSGSPLFNNNHQIIGLLSGGSSKCSESSNPDLYGKISKAFNSGNFGNYLGQGYTSVGTYVPPINYDLPLTIETDPKHVFIGNNTKVKVKASGGTAPIRWWIWINKEPDDFGNYQYGTSDCFNWSGTSNTGNFETGNHIFTQVGTYKCTVYALDAMGRQSSNIVFTIVVTESFNPCVSAYIYQTDQTSNQLIFPRGARLSVSEFCNVKTGYLPYALADACYLDYFDFDRSNVYSKYQDIGKIEWFYNDQLISSRTFNIAGISSPVGGTYPYPLYYYTPSTQCFQLDEAGTHIIKLNAYGGRYVKTGSRYVYPLSAIDAPSTVTMKIQVVDCDKYLILNALKYALLPKIDFKSGHIIVENMTVSTKPINLTAYRTITLKPGTHIRNGAVFSAKIEKCPEFDGDCNNIKSFSINEHDDISETITNILVYPNPAREVINIDMNDNFPKIIYYEIYDTAGKLLAKKIPEDHIEKYYFREQPNGIYLVRIVYKDWTEEVKKVILDR
jgi:hypothetical protein